MPAKQKFNYTFRVKDKKGDIRKITIYLMKEYTGAKNKQIGELMGCVSYSAVAKTYQRFKNKIEMDRGLRRRIDEIEAKLSFVNGLTPIPITQIRSLGGNTAQGITFVWNSFIPEIILSPLL
jgi:hypothetical protein